MSGGPAKAPGRAGITLRLLREADLPLIKASHKQLFSFELDSDVSLEEAVKTGRYLSVAAVDTQADGTEQLAGFVVSCIASLQTFSDAGYKAGPYSSLPLGGPNGLGGLIPMGFKPEDMAINICLLGVFEGYRRRGVASTMLQQILSSARDSRASLVFLHVMTTNSAARKFYLQNGFRVATHIPGFYPVSPGHAFLLYNPLMGLDEGAMAAASAAQVAAAKAAAAALVSQAAASLLVGSVEGTEMSLRSAAAEARDIAAREAVAEAKLEGPAAPAAGAQPALQEGSGLACASEPSREQDNLYVASPSVAGGMAGASANSDATSRPGPALTPASSQTPPHHQGESGRGGSSEPVPSGLLQAASSQVVFGYQLAVPGPGLFRSGAAKGQGRGEGNAADCSSTNGRVGSAALASGDGEAGVDGVGQSSEIPDSWLRSPSPSPIASSPAGASPAEGDSKPNGSQAREGPRAGSQQAGLGLLRLLRAAGNGLLQGLLPGFSRGGGTWRAAAAVEVGGETLRVVTRADGEVALEEAQAKVGTADVESEDAGGDAGIQSDSLASEGAGVEIAPQSVTIMAGPAVRGASMVPIQAPVLEQRWRSSNSCSSVAAAGLCMVAGQPGWASQGRHLQRMPNTRVPGRGTAWVASSVQRQTNRGLLTQQQQPVIRWKGKALRLGAGARCPSHVSPCLRI